jgi:hypothetical protein
MKVPSSPVEWESIANEFHNIWNFTHCVGALDGKHIRISFPALCGSQFYNFKNFHSIVLMGLADARYRFIIIDVGAR